MLAAGHLIVTQHPFYSFISESRLNTWVDRIDSTPDTLFRECACLGKPFRGVDESTQAQLADALVTRSSELRQIVASHREIIGYQP